MIEPTELTLTQYGEYIINEVKKSFLDFCGREPSDTEVNLIREIVNEWMSGKPITERGYAGQNIIAWNAVKDVLSENELPKEFRPSKPLTDEQTQLREDLHRLFDGPFTQFMEAQGYQTPNVNNPTHYESFQRWLTNGQPVAQPQELPPEQLNQNINELMAEYGELAAEQATLDKEDPRYQEIEARLGQITAQSMTLLPQLLEPDESTREKYRKWVNLNIPDLETRKWLHDNYDVFGDEVQRWFDIAEDQNAPPPELAAIMEYLDWESEYATAQATVKVEAAESEQRKAEEDFKGKYLLWIQAQDVSVAEQEWLLGKLDTVQARFMNDLALARERKEFQPILTWVESFMKGWKGAYETESFQPSLEFTQAFESGLAALSSNYEEYQFMINKESEWAYDYYKDALAAKTKGEKLDVDDWLKNRAQEAQSEYTELKYPQDTQSRLEMFQDAYRKRVVNSGLSNDIVEYLLSSNNVARFTLQYERQIGQQYVEAGQFIEDNMPIWLQETPEGKEKLEVETRAASAEFAASRGIPTPWGFGGTPEEVQARIAALPTRQEEDFGKAYLTWATKLAGTTDPTDPYLKWLRSKYTDYLFGFEAQPAEHIEKPEMYRLPSTGEEFKTNTPLGSYLWNKEQMQRKPFTEYMSQQDPFNEYQEYQRQLSMSKPKPRRTYTVYR